MNSASSRIHYPALDGLRGIAIILVLFCHNLNFIPHFEFGWIGVDLFFVLSGFLITDILIRSRESRHYLQNFYLRRVLRIFPLYYAIVLIYFVLGPVLQNLQVQYSYYQSHAAMSWFHLQNWMYIFNPKPNDNLLMGHFWSLSVEEQFYLIWPFVVLAARNNRWLARISFALLLLCIGGRFISWACFGDGYTNFHFQYMTRIDGLCIGSMIAAWKTEGYHFARKTLIRLSGILLGAHALLFLVSKTLWTSLPNFPFLGYSTIAILFGLAVFFAAEKRNRISILFLENRHIRYIGKISYGLYVFHWPLLSLSKLYLLPLTVGRGFSFESAYMLVSILALIVAFALSAASYHYFESRILALKEVITSEGFFARLKRRLSLLVFPASTR